MSHQTKNREHLQSWKNFIYGRARQAWPNTPLAQHNELRLSLVYLCDDQPVDIDNIIKPIQDALVGVVFADDLQVTDVDSHRRFLSDPIDVTFLPKLLQQAVLIGEECVYIRVTLAENLEQYL